MSAGRHWTSTWIHTSSGMRPSSMSWRVKSKSGFDAAGNPISISLNPVRTSVWKRRSLRGGALGGGGTVVEVGGGGAARAADARLAHVHLDRRRGIVRDRAQQPLDLVALEPHRHDAAAHRVPAGDGAE